MEKELTLYLVKKDVNMPAQEGNWFFMRQKEFDEFIGTKEGEMRKNSFIRLPGYDDGVITYVIECDDDNKAETRKEKNHKDYLRQQQVSSGISTISFESSQRGVNLWECIPDETMDVEYEVIKRLQLESLRKALLLLDDYDQFIIRRMYLNDDGEDNNLSRLAAELGITHQKLRRQLNLAEYRLKKYMK